MSRLSAFLNPKASDLEKEVYLSDRFVDDKGKPETVNVIATLKPTAVDTIDYQPGTHEDIYLRMKVDAGKCRFYYSLDGKKYKSAGSEFTMREGKWIGAKIGLVAAEPAGKANRGWIDADWFRITK